jgi:steroid 5-alpha reductase family enzyme
LSWFGAFVSEAIFSSASARITHTKTFATQSSVRNGVSQPPARCSFFFNFKVRYKSVPAILVVLDGETFASGMGLGASGLLGVAFWATGLLGESLADRQLARFRADPANKGKICQIGLWNYSRHPNYFFEWLVWVGYAVFALGSPWGWLGFIAPALMLHFLLNVTGIPMTEELSLKSKGDAYREYQRTTSAFVPWFKKS